MAFALVTGLAACGTRVSDPDLVAAGNQTVADGTGLVGTGGGTGGEQSATTGTSSAGSTGANPGTAGVGTTGAQQGSTGTGAGPATGAATAGGPSATSSTSSTSTTGTSGPATTSGKPAPGAGTTGPAAAGDAPCAAPLAPLVVGQVGTLSGFLAPNLGGFRPGLAAWAADVNSRGGIQCHPVRLAVVDDQANPSKTVSGVRDVINNKKAVVMVGSPVPFTLTPYIAETKAAGIPTIGGDSVGLEWSTDPILFPTGVGFFNGGIAGGLASVRARTGKTKMGLMSCVEAQPCSQAKAVFASAVKAAGGVNMGTQAVSLTQTDYTSACQNFKNAGVEIVSTLVDASALVRIFRSCASIGYRPFGATVGLGVAPVSIEDENVGKATVTVAASTAPYFSSNIPAVAAYQDAMKRYSPGAVLDYASISAWTSGKFLERGLALVSAQARSGPITTKLIQQGMGKIKNETFNGLLPKPVTWTEGAGHAVPQCFFTTIIQGGKIVDPTNGKPACAG